MVDDFFGDPMSPADEINARLGYDADVTDSRQYCEHGTFIGSPWGPDYLCFYCETGTEPPPPAPYRLTIGTRRTFNSTYHQTREAVNGDPILRLLRDAVAANPDGALFARIAEEREGAGYVTVDDIA